MNGNIYYILKTDTATGLEEKVNQFLEAGAKLVGNHMH